MELRYALVNIKSRAAVNVIIVDSQGTWQPPEGFEIVQSELANIEDNYVDGEFIKPVDPIISTEETPAV